MVDLSNGNNWFLNISDKKITKDNLEVPIFLSESMEYLRYMTNEGKYENSKGFNEFYIYEIEVFPGSKIFGNSKDDIEKLKNYLKRIRQLKFQSHGGWGKSYTKSEILNILSEGFEWYITEAKFMKDFYRVENYDGFLTKEREWENLCILEKNKILAIDKVPLKDLEDNWGLDEEFKLTEVEKPQSFARILAQIAHDDMGQKRKSSGKPYWTHPQTVADIVESYGGNEEQIIAAELHDTIEDVEGFSLDLLEDNFSVKVRDIILELTNDDSAIKRIENKVFKGKEYSKQKAKELYMNNKLVNLSNSALLVKLADFYSNFTDSPKQKQKERMINNIKYLAKNRKVTGNCRELLDSIISFIKKDRNAHRT